MPKAMTYKRPKNTKRPPAAHMGYLGRHKLALGIVAVLVFIGSRANIMGTYLLKPVINNSSCPATWAGCW